MTHRTHRTPCVGGFTLIEVLAAVVLLSAVAGVVIPLTLRVGQRAERLDVAHEARVVLADAVRLGPPQAGIRTGLAHDWWMQVVPLRLDAPAAHATPSHTWTVVRVCRGSPEDPEVLAEQYVAQPRQDP